MLQLPAAEYFSDLRVTACQDDAKFWTYYIIPDYISIRRDTSGNPVFLLVKYAFSDEDREAHPDLGKGGGFVAFDVEMSVPEADRHAIVERLQERVDQEWRTLKDAAEAAGQDVRGARVASWYRNQDGEARNRGLSTGDVRLGLPHDVPEAPPGDRPPKVVLAAPTWTQGTFEISAPQSEQLVSHRVTAGPVSLVGSNTASADMDLTEAGATFMEKTLLDPDGTGGSDLTPIQVRMNLKHWARIPPVRLMIEADSRSLYAALRSIEHDYDGHSCEEDDMYHYESNLELAVRSGLIKVRLDTGTLALTDDFVQELRGQALKFVQDLIKDNFYAPKERQPSDDDDGPNFEDDKKTDVYYLKTDVSLESVSINYNEKLTSIVEWPVNPQGTMQSFFADLSADEMRKYVRIADLDDALYKSLGLKVTCFADFDNQPIAFVECQLSYSGRDENNQQVDKVETFTFTSDHRSDTWDPSLIGTKREYSYRWRVGFTGHEPGEFTHWERETTPNLNLSIGDPGKIAVHVLAGNIDFAQTVRQAQVELSYADAGSGVREESEIVVLADGQLQQSYERYVYTEWDQPLRYRSTIFLKDGQRIEGDWDETLSKQLLVNAPLYDTLDVRLVPVGEGWDDVLQAVVSLRYNDDANDYHVDQAFQLRAVDEFKTWSVTLRDPAQRAFEYKVLTTYKDGTFSESQWTKEDGDQALPVLVRESPALNISLLPNLLDFKVTPVVLCTLRYDDQAGNVHKVQTFTFTSAQPAAWRIPIASDDRRSYRLELTYHTIDGKTVTVPPAASDATSVVIPKLAVPEVVTTVIPKLIDFVQTPVVEVGLEYDDERNGIHAEDTLVFTAVEDQVFRVQVRDGSPDDYTVTVTYYLADGRTVTGEPVTTDKKRIVLPRYVAGE